MIVERHRAMADRMAHAFKPGMGYVAVGRPLMPLRPAAQAAACEPPAPAAEGSMHVLMSPDNGPAKTLRWHPAQREWSPLVTGQGNRLGWTSAYLAAHGWTYEGPAPVA